jgi:hypothetical protein
MNFVCAHLGDIHLEEDHYFADTIQCLDWFVADAMQSHTFYNGVGFVKRHFHPCGLGAGRGAPQALIADP